MLNRIRRAIVFPGSRGGGGTAGQAAPPQLPTKLVSISTKAGEIVRVVAPFNSAIGQDAVHVVFFYGNAMCAGDTMGGLSLFDLPGTALWVPDYPGYGYSTGVASESGCLRAGHAMHRYLTETLGVLSSRIVVAGWSLGSAVAIDVASKYPVGGLVALSPFTSLHDLAKQLGPLARAGSLLLRLGLDNLKKASGVTCPAVVGHGQSDRLISCSMGKQVADAIAGSVTWVPIANVGHNDLLGCGDPALTGAVHRLLKPIADRSSV